MKKICFSLILLFFAQNCLSMQNESRRLLPQTTDLSIARFSSLASREHSSADTTRMDGENPNNEETTTAVHHRTTSTSPMIPFIVTSDNRGTALRMPIRSTAINTTNDDSANQPLPLTKGQRCCCVATVVTLSSFAVFFLYLIEQFNMKNTRSSNSTMIWPD